MLSSKSALTARGFGSGLRPSHAHGMDVHTAPKSSLTSHLFCSVLITPVARDLDGSAQQRDNGRQKCVYSSFLTLCVNACSATTTHEPLKHSRLWGKNVSFWGPSLIFDLARIVRSDSMGISDCEPLLSPPCTPSHTSCVQPGCTYSAPSQSCLDILMSARDY